MAGLAIDSNRIAEHCIPQLQNYLDAVAGQTTGQVRKIYAHATIVHDAKLRSQLCFENLTPPARIVAVQGALDHQADLADDLDEIEVFHHVNQHAETSSLLLELASHIPSTKLAASCSGAAAMSRPRRPASGESHNFNIGFFCENTCTFPRGWRSSTGSPFRATALSDEPACVSRNVQLDVVDRGCPTSRPEKRRRTTVNLSHQGDGRTDRTEEKQFKGVRYRPDRKKWVAEMKPPKHGNKVSFGEFKSQEQAARVVDAAFHYYKKPHFLNFPETSPQVLAKPMPAELDEKEKLVFVKEQAKWLASMDSIPPSSLSTSVPSSRICEFSDRCQGMLVIYRYMSPPATMSSIPRHFCEEPAQELLEQQWNEPDGYASTLN